MDKALNLLEGLATKIGTVVEALWPAYVQYIVWDAVAQIIGASLLVTFACWCRKFVANYKFNSCGEAKGPAQGFSFAGLILAVIIFSVVFSTSLPRIIQPVGYSVSAILGR